MTNENEKKGWNPPLLAGALAVTLLLACSWFIPGPWRDAWNAIDEWTFFTLNGMLAGNQPMAVFWAFVNNRSFDLVPAFLFLFLFWHYMAAGGPREELLERVTSCVLMACYALVTVQLARLFLEIDRSSPSKILEPVHLLTEMVPWLPTKDSSSSSFPGDHGTVSIMFSIFLIRCYGLRALGWAAGLILLSILPRLVGGAHWLTDIAIGSLIIALPPMALFFATPLHSRLVRRLTAVIQHRLPWVEFLVVQALDPEIPKLVGKGMCMGSADIIPGVSGGTMAYILGIYRRLLEAITVFNPKWLRLLLRLEIKKAAAAIPFFFLLPLGFGIILAVIIFTKMIPLPYFVQHHPEPIYGLFFGLVGGSVILLLKKYARLSIKPGLAVFAGIALGTIIVSLVPARTPDASWFIFLCGALAISAMLLPGISGSFILLILGKYALILGAIGSLDISVLVPFLLGCLIGLLTFAHSLKWLMQHYSEIMNMLITGVLIGTLRAVWPFQNRTYIEISGKEKLIGTEPFWPSMDAWLSLAGLMMLIGFAVIYLLAWLSRTRHS
ncbi:MAG: undecaprenyl phosphate translocase family protein [Thermodesulfobacteriota bacterium]